MGWPGRRLSGARAPPGADRLVLRRALAARARVGRARGPAGTARGPPRISDLDGCAIP